jgi:hypothetical protein
LEGLTFAYFGINGSTATATEDDHTVRKWIGFTKINGGSRFIVGNAFAYRATDVSMLEKALDPVGPENDRYIQEIVAEADVLIPCWGSRTKIPPHLHARLDWLRDVLFSAGKPVKIFGLVNSGDPKHPLTLGYSTCLSDWVPQLG